MSDDHVKRLRDARKWFNNDGQCCGQVDSVGTCAAPACIFGEALKEFYQAADLIEAQAAEIARLRAACDASEERERAIELRFWQTVDRDGLTGLPSDMWAALEQLTQDRAALSAARREGMEEAAQRAFEYARTAWQHGSLPVDPHECAAQAAREIAAAIRAAAKEVK